MLYLHCIYVVFTLYFHVVFTLYLYCVEGYKVFLEGERTISTCGWLEFLANGIPNVKEELGKRQELFGRVKRQIGRLSHQPTG